MRIVLYPYRNVGLPLPGRIILHRISCYQSVLTRLLLSSFNSSMHVQKVTNTVYFDGFATNYPYSLWGTLGRNHKVPPQTYFINCDVENVITNN